MQQCCTTTCSKMHSTSHFLLPIWSLLFLACLHLCISAPVKVHVMGFGQHCVQHYVLDSITFRAGQHFLLRHRRLPLFQGGHYLACITHARFVMPL